MSYNYNSEKTPLFLSDQSYRTDCCASEAKDTQNVSIVNHELYQYLPVPCNNDSKMRSPNFQYDHPNLRAKIGYGLSDSCTIDRYSDLRNEESQLTHDRCKKQLFTRVFFDVPSLKPGHYDSDLDEGLKQGTSTRDFAGFKYPCMKQIMETDYNRNVPLIRCLAETIQDPEYHVEPWIRGGEDTRETVRRAEFLESCGYKYDGRVWR